MKVYALGTCHPNCSFCAREWWKWLKGQLSRKWGGEKFYDHAGRSMHGPMLIRLTPNRTIASMSPMTSRTRARNAVLIATAIEIHCPHCDAAQPAPGGSEFCEPHEAREICDGQVRPCVACDEPIRLTWHEKVPVA